jgi:hypothetical protein
MKKGDLMIVGANIGWGEGSMKKGDLVVVMEPDHGAPWGLVTAVAQVLHPNVGVCYIHGCRLEVVDESATG